MLNKKTLTSKEMKGYSGGAAHIRYYRNEKCLSQEYMATKLGISQSTYQKIEAGNVKITKERLIEIANILGKELNDFESNTMCKLEQNNISLLKEAIVLQSKEIQQLKIRLAEKETELKKVRSLHNL
ncbi:helix-turn-helix domain-containing protein [Pedobacter montanisoli]|uniref:Helix-turn-helix domain-containing protein n=1 Tax=Pedobacter montanisoli TaxID=2923277 RepID=A0ABS9ZSB6_9SPHI|nr:helix-turn-helix transcriptional regulator [Pedobacter montanisoli]MCJ0741480.1 helix-turn-helix domain-containing protein [Pedobacter montanisoli]